MDSMAERLEQLLSDDNTVSQIQQVIASLRDGGGQQQSGSAPQGCISTEGSFDSSMLSGLAGLLPGLMSGGGDDPNIALLRALRPFLSSKRKKRVSEAVRMMKMMDMLPLLQDSGVLKGFLGGDEEDG